MAPNPQKPILREQLLAARAALSDGRRAQAQAAMVEHLVAVLAARPVGAIAAYWPIRSEPDLAPAWKILRARGWTLCLPVVAAAQAPLMFRAWNGDPPQARDACGLRVPAADAPALTPDVLVLPCLGFHAHGYRLGYGGGYYDRTLAGMATSTFKLGVAFEEQLCEFAVDAHDLRMDALVTEDGLRRWNTAG